MHTIMEESKNLKLRHIVKRNQEKIHLQQHQNVTILEDKYNKNENKDYILKLQKI